MESNNNININNNNNNFLVSQLMHVYIHLKSFVIFGIDLNSPFPPPSPLKWIEIDIEAYNNFLRLDLPNNNNNNKSVNQLINISDLIPPPLEILRVLKEMCNFMIKSYKDRGGGGEGSNQSHVTWPQFASSIYIGLFLLFNSIKKNQHV